MFFWRKLLKILKQNIIFDIKSEINKMRAKCETNLKAENFSEH